MLKTIIDTLRAYAWWFSLEAKSRVGSRRLGNAGERHALLMVSALPPFLGGGIPRPLSWLQYAGRCGWRMTAITHEVTGEISAAGQELLDRIPHDVRIRRLDLADWLSSRWQPSWRLFGRIASDFDTALAYADHGMRLMDADPPSVVVATGPPFSMFIAGLYLARRFACPLVLDYRDEWTECPFDFVTSGGGDRFWERRCLKAADWVFFTTASQLDHTNRVFGGILDGKAAVLTNGWERQDFSGRAAGPRVGTTNRPDLVLKFVGTLGHWTSPLDFLADIDARGNGANDLQLRIDFVGCSEKSTCEAIDARFRHLPISRTDWIPKSEVARTLAAADALLLFAPEGLARYLPGKLFDYLASGRPILVHGHPGEASRLVEALGAGLFVRAGDLDVLRNALALVRTRPVESWNPPRRQAWLDEHTRETLAGDFFATLNELTAGRKDPHHHRVNANHVHAPGLPR